MTLIERASHPDASAIRTLIVDDCEVVRTSLVKFVKTIPAIELVGVAATGIEAIELAGEKKPQLVLMDFQMPGLNGLEAALLLRDLDPTIRVILISAEDLSFVEDCWGAGGADAFVHKANLIYELKPTINRLFTR